MTTDATDKKFIAYAPNGTKIWGQLHTIREVVAVVDHFKSADNLNTQSDDVITWVGESEVNWDTQEPIIRDDEIVYVDVDGGQWRASDLVLKEDQDFQPEPKPRPLLEIIAEKATQQRQREALAAAQKVASPYHSAAKKMSEALGPHLADNLALTYGPTMRSAERAGIYYQGEVYALVIADGLVFARRNGLSDEVALFTDSTVDGELKTTLVAASSPAAVEEALRLGQPTSWARLKGMTNTFTTSDLSLSRDAYVARWMMAVNDARTQEAGRVIEAATKGGSHA